MTTETLPDTQTWLARPLSKWGGPFLDANGTLLVYGPTVRHEGPDIFRRGIDGGHGLEIDAFNSDGRRLYTLRPGRRIGRVFVVVGYLHTFAALPFVPRPQHQFDSRPAPARAVYDVRTGHNLGRISRPPGNLFLPRARSSSAADAADDLSAKACGASQRNLCKDKSAMSEQIPRREINLQELKALAHPLRQRMLYHLAFVGPASATSIAKVFGESTGATSYHLRQLARFGFIEEVPERSRGRERWWQLVPLDLRGLSADAPLSEEDGAVAGELECIRLERDRHLLSRYLHERERFAGWDEIAMFSSSATRLTKDELARFGEDYVALLKSYWRTPEECPADAEPIAVLFYAFPWPGE